MNLFNDYPEAYAAIAVSLAWVALPFVPRPKSRVGQLAMAFFNDRMVFIGILIVLLSRPLARNFIGAV